MQVCYNMYVISMLDNSSAKWFNLNSLLKRPELISDTYLSLFLHQLQLEGSNVHLFSFSVGLVCALQSLNFLLGVLCTSIAGIFHRGQIFAFFTMERIHENYVRENLLRMRVHGAGMHLHCTNNKPAISSAIPLFYGYAKIYHHEKYPLYGAVFDFVLTSCTNDMPCMLLK